MSQKRNFRGNYYGYGACSVFDNENSCHTRSVYMSSEDDECIGWLQGVYVMYIIAECYMFDLWQE